MRMVVEGQTFEYDISENNKGLHAGGEWKVKYLFVQLASGKRSRIRGSKRSLRRLKNEVTTRASRRVIR